MTEPRVIAITMDTSRRISTIATGYEEVPVLYECDDGYSYERWMPTDDAVREVQAHSEQNTETERP